MDDRLLDSPSNELETFREYQSSDSERESPHSSRSELTESTLIQTQPSTLSSTSEHTVSKSTSMLQPYPEHDVEPCSQYAHHSIWHQSKTVRRQNDREADFLATTDDADLVDENVMNSSSNDMETFRQHRTSDSEREHPPSSRTESKLLPKPPSTLSSTLEHTVSKSTSTMQSYPEHDVGLRSQYAQPPIRHQSKLTRNERWKNDQEAQAGFSHRDSSYKTRKVCVFTLFVVKSIYNRSSIFQAWE